MGSALKGSLQLLVFSTEGLFGCSRQPTLILPKVQGSSQASCLEAPGRLDIRSKRPHHLLGTGILGETGAISDVPFAPLATHSKKPAYFLVHTVYCIFTTAATC